MITSSGAQAAAIGIAPPGGAAQISRSAIFGASAYDIVRGDLDALASSGGNFTLSTTACLSNNQAATFLPDPTIPTVNDGFWYLVRPANCGGGGSYDSGHPSQSGLRDVEIAASAFACP